MRALSLTNTMTGKKSIYVPQKDGQLLMYVCGITPYDYAHVGHGRCYVTFDLLYRLAQALGIKVTYCRNFTDIDDKLLTRAQKELGNQMRYQEIASRYINAYIQDMEQLACIRPTYEPRVTDHIPEIIHCIQGLIDAGKAYTVACGDVYYHVRSFSAYGKLSHRNIDDLKSGARVGIEPDKKDPLDFALWKSESDGTFWKSPWGWGRPGWHIECSALAHRYLGVTLDVHGGGMDLIFPHHENEIAQSEGLFDRELARFWVHNAFVRINKEKMSKSLGNFFTLRDIFSKFDPLVLRYYFLTHQYRNPLDFSFDDLAVAQKSYQKLCRLFETVQAHSVMTLEQLKVQVRTEYHNIIDAMFNYLYDDLNTPGFLGVVFEHISLITAHEDLLRAVRTIFEHFLGLSLIPLPEKQVAITPEIQELIDARESARKARDFKRADELRDKLKELGVDLQDRKLAGK